MATFRIYDQNSLFHITQTICILVKNNVAFIADILTHSITSPKCKEEIGIVELVVIAHDFANRLRGLSTVIKRNP
jgi:hypothetical protein